MPEGTFINAALSVDLVAFVLAVMLAWTVKYAFIDSWIMVKMMHGYMRGSNDGHYIRPLHQVERTFKQLQETIQRESCNT